MQPDFDRLLRESRSAVPEPDPAAKRRGIGLVLARVEVGRGRRRVGFFSAAVVALLAASLAVAAERIVRDPDRTEAVAAFRTIDRTLVCATALSGGVPDRVRNITITAQTVRGEGEAHVPALIYLNTGEFGTLAPLVSVETGESSGRQPAVLFNHRRCKGIKPRLPVVREQRSARPVDFSAGCELLDAPAKVVVRLRAVMESPTRWRITRDSTGASYTRALGKALVAFVAVKSHPGRKRLVFASLDRAGTARFLGVSRCGR